MKRQLSLEFNKYTPVSNGNSYLLYQYESIASFIKANFRPDLHDILLKPVKRNEGIDYFSEDRGDYKELSAFSQHEQLPILQKYNAFLYEIERKCKQLEQGEELDDQKWAAMLRLVFDMDTSVILTDGKQVRLAWGLKFYNKAKYILPFEAYSSHIFQENIKIDEPTVTQATDDSLEEPSDISDTSAISSDSNLISDGEIKGLSDEKQTDEPVQNNNVEPDVNPPVPKPPAPQIPPPKPNGFLLALNGFEAFMKKYWWLVLLLLLLALLFWYFSDKKNNENLSASQMDPVEVERIYRDIMPPNPRNRIRPIEDEEIVEDDQTKVKIVSNLINIALKKKTDNFRHFAVDLKRAYPDYANQIIYFDDSTRRLQLEFPDDQRASIKADLRSKLTAYELLIWDESIFQSNRIPNDPSFSDRDKSWPLFMVNAPKAWDITTGQSSVVVAVIDGGFDLEHLDLKNKYILPYNVVNRNTSITYGPEGHGTHVAGLIAASGNNGIGIAGVAPSCRFIPIQAISDGDIFTMTDVIDGILYAIKNKANVINMSLGKMFGEGVSELSAEELEQIRNVYGIDEAQFWDELFQMADDNNVTIVLAAGNENLPVGLDPMVRSDKTIKVTAINQQRLKADFSNYFNVLPDNGTCLSAPGEDIYSTLPGNEFAELDGTSMACPIVSGAVALIKSIKPNIRNAELFSILHSTGLNLNDQTIGPLIQIDRALARVRLGQ
jgi:subtilisin family serine protease